MAPILNELKNLDNDLMDNDFLGKGTLTVSEIFYSSLQDVLLQMDVVFL